MPPSAAPSANTAPPNDRPPGRTIITKLLRPSAANLIPRDFVTAWTGQAQAHRLSVLTAPAGFGKTSVLALMAEAWAGPVVWYSLDRSDRDLKAFCEHLAVGLAMALPGRELTFPHLAAASPSPARDEVRLPALVADLAGLGVGGRAAVPSLGIFLDDFHEVDEPDGAVPAFVTALVEHLPSHVCLVMSSRRPLGLPLARWRVRRLLFEGSGRQLLFSADDVRAYYALAAGAALDEAAARAVAERVSGWPAAVVLTAASPASSGSVAAFDEIDAYLAEEAFGGIPAALATFLEDTSVFPSFSPAMAVRLMGPDAAERLAEVERLGLFLERRGPPPGHYRLHGLFRDFLGKRLRSRLTGPALAAFLTRAAVVARDEGDLGRAFALFAEAGRTEQVLELLTAHGERLLNAGRSETVRFWVRRASALSLAETPIVACLAGRLAEREGNPHLAETRLRHAYASGDPAVRLPAVTALVKLLVNQGRADEATELAREGLELARKGSEPTRAGSEPAPGRNAGAEATLLHLLARAAWFSKDWTTAQEFAQRAMVLYRRAGDGAGEAGIQNDLAAVFYEPKGLFGRALRAFGRAYRLSRDASLLDAAAIALANIGLVQGALGEYGRAVTSVRRALEGCRRLRFVRGEGLCLAFLGELYSYSGDLSRAAEALDDALALQERINEPVRLAGVYFAQAHLARLRGDLEEARRLAEEDLRLVRPIGNDHVLAQSLRNLGYIRLAEGRPQEAAALFREALGCYTRWESYVEIARIHAGLAAALGDTAEGRESLRQALLLSERHDFAAVLARDAALLTPALELAVRAGMSPDYADKVLRRWRSGAPIPTGAPTLNRGHAGDTPLQVTTLGPFTVSQGDQPFAAGTWAKAKEQALMKFLIVNRGRWIPQDVLLESLWPGMEPHAARHNLAVTIYGLRRALEPGLAKGTKSRFVLYLRRQCRFAGPPVVWVDADAFEAGVTKGEALARDGRSEDALAAFSAAEVLYRGPFLEEDPYEDWAASQRARCHDLYLRALTGQGALHAASGRWASAVSALEKAVSLEPLREDLCRKLMEHLGAAGRPDEARAAFHRLAGGLAETLSATPSAETAALFARLARR